MMKALICYGFLSHSLCLCAYTIVMPLFLFWWGSEIKACVRFAIFHQKSSVPINSTDCNLACAPMNTWKQFFSRSPMASLIKPGMLLSPCLRALSHCHCPKFRWYYPPAFLLFSGHLFSDVFFRASFPLATPLVLAVSWVLFYPLSTHQPWWSHSFPDSFHAGDSQIITSSLGLQICLFNCFLDIIFRWLTEG